MRRSGLLDLAAPLALLTTLMLVAGCSSQTRLGYLIPAHRNSDSSDKEVVRVSFYPDPIPPRPTPIPDLEGEDAEAKKKRMAKEAKEAAFLAPFAIEGAKLAVDYVRGELEKEAKRYEAQFNGRVVASTDDLKRSGYLVVERWVDDRMLNLGDEDVPTSAEPDYSALTHAARSAADAARDEAAKKAPPTQFANVTPKSDLAVDDDDPKKLLAFLFVARIKPVQGDYWSYKAGPFEISPQYVWVWKTKAKVVDLSFNESWKIWQWIGAVALKTDNKANVKLEVGIKAISTDEKTGPQLVEVNTSAPIVVKLQSDLDKPKVHWASPTSGIYFDVPRYSARKDQATLQVAPAGHGIGAPAAAKPKESAATDPTGPYPLGVGFAVFDVSVTDSDASNVRQLLESGAKKLDDKRDDIAGSVGKLFE